MMVPKDDAQVDANAPLAGDGSNDVLDNSHVRERSLRQPFLHRARSVVECLH